MSVYCECCVLSGRGLCVWLINHLEDSYRVWRVVLCDHEVSIIRRNCHTRGVGGCCATGMFEKLQRTTALRTPRHKQEDNIKNVFTQIHKR
jgi:hypothetical protein